MIHALQHHGSILAVMETLLHHCIPNTFVFFFVILVEKVTKSWFFSQETLGYQLEEDQPYIW